MVDFKFGGNVTRSFAQRFNLHPNPKAGVDVTYMLGSVQSGTGSLTRAAVAGPIAGINTVFQNTVTSGSPTYLDIRNTPTSLPITPGGNYNFSAYVRTIAPSSSQVMHYVQWFASNGVTVITTTIGSAVSTTSGTWQRLEFASPTVPPNAYYASHIVRGLSSSTFTTGNTCQVSGFLVEPL